MFGRVLVVVALASTLLAGAAADASAGTQPRSCKVVYLRYDAPDGFYSVNPNGSGRIRLREIPEGALWAVWSPDGTLITAGDGGILAFGADGRRIPISSVRGAAALVDGGTWSPDGGQIAFSRDLGKGRRSIFVVHPDGSGLRNLTPRGDNHFTSWSPDSRHILFWRGLGGLKSAIYTMNSDGTGVRRVALPFESAGDADWSPDGRRMVFAVGDEGRDKPGIYVADIDGTNLHRLTIEAYDGGPLWSPDGAKIAFTRLLGGDPPAEADVMNANGSGLHAIASANSQSEWDLGVYAETWLCTPR
jgi:TolB protein